MSRTERILERFPSFYKTWDDRSRIYKVATALGKRLDEADKDSTKILRSHWVDTAFGKDLDRLGALFNLKRRSEESDFQYRNRLKRAIVEFKGGGTVGAVLASVRTALGLPKDYPIKLVENPPFEAEKILEVRTGDTWVASSSSVLDAVPSVTLTVMTADAKVTNPTLANLDTGEKITFNGTVRSGETLRLEEGRAIFDEADMSENLSSKKVPRLLRKGSMWSYSELVEEEIGVLDRAKFDSSVFAIGIPIIRLVFSWTAYQPAAFEIEIPKGAIPKNGGLSLVQEIVDTIKAAGVKALVKAA